jgi:hypothetical protein
MFSSGQSPGVWILYAVALEHCLFHLHRLVGVETYEVYEDGTECSETSAYKIQTPGNYPEENIQQILY